MRPLRELTGEALFNEVFFDDVFVPDECVVGEVGQGWRVARATLGNERVSIGGGGAGVLPVKARDLFPLAAAAPDPHVAEREVAALVVDELAMRLLLLRQAARAVGGIEPGPEGNLSKLFSSEHAQRLTGPRGAARGRRGGHRAQRADHACLPLGALPHDRGRHLGDRPQPGRRTHPRACPATRCCAEAHLPVT